jgi:hypothetical protein
MAARALVNMTVGGRMASKADPARVVEQWREHEHELFVGVHALYSSYPPTLFRVASILEQAELRGMTAGYR